MLTMMQILDCFKLYILFITCDRVLVRNCISLVIGDAMRCVSLSRLTCFRVSLAFADRQGAGKTDDYPMEQHKPKSTACRRLVRLSQLSSPLVLSHAAMILLTLPTPKGHRKAYSWLDIKAHQDRRRFTNSQYRGFRRREHVENKGHGI